MQTTDELKPVDINEIAEMAEQCHAEKIYVHWTAGHYGQIYGDYHISIDYDGKIYLPFDNHDLDQYRQHTWMRNSGSIGIALCGAYGAEANHGWDADMGDEPITETQIEVASVVIATICKHAGIPIDSVQTHCEAALEDGYGPWQGDPETRWDLWFLRDNCDGQMKPGGEVLRGKARWYIR